MGKPKILLIIENHIFNKSHDVIVPNYITFTQNLTGYDFRNLKGLRITIGMEKNFQLGGIENNILENRKMYKV